MIKDAWLTKLAQLRRLVYRNTVAALLATAVDYLVFEVLVAYVVMRIGIATVFGCVAGALVNFFMNRIWTFNSHAATLPQLQRYALVSASGALLNAVGVEWLAHATQWDHRVVWLIIRLLVSWGWNLPLQRFFVFGPVAR